MNTGLMFLPFSITMILAAIVTSRLVQRFDPGRLAGVGATIAAVAVFGMSRLPYDDRLGQLAVDISYWTDIFPFVVLMPIGLSLVFIPMTMSVVHAVSPADSGIASGVLNTMQQVGGALGLATLIDDRAQRRVREGHRPVRRRCGATRASEPVLAVSFTHGATIGFLACSVMLLVGGIVALVFNRIQHEDLGGREAPVEVAAH